MKHQTRLIVITRAREVCELCGGPLHNGMSIHHRKPRQMGGSTLDWINTPVNLLAVCGSGVTGCHGRIESFRATAYQFGWLVHNGNHPEQVPYGDLQGRWWLLQDNIKLPLHLPFTPPNPTSTP